MIDFSKCEIDMLATYGGSDQKRGIIYDGKRYMLKMSDRIDTKDRNDLRDSYSNSVYSEYICCHILNMLGYKAQNTLLGTIVADTKRHTDKIVPVVACENFIPEGYELVEFKNIANALLSTKPGKTPRMWEIYEVLGEENQYFDIKTGKEALDRYWDTFIFDAYFGNFDRHGNNWGYLINKDTKEVTLAPIYDCGSCLYPQLADEAIEGIINNQDEIEMRVYKFPNAALELDNKEKVNYHNFINSLENDDCTNALLRVFPKINQSMINEFIDEIEEISELRKTFYKTMLTKRYERILQPAYEKALNKMQNFNNEFNKDSDSDIELE